MTRSKWVLLIFGFIIYRAWIFFQSFGFNWFDPLLIRISTRLVSTKVLITELYLIEGFVWIVLICLENFGFEFVCFVIELNRFLLKLILIHKKVLQRERERGGGIDCLKVLLVMVTANDPIESLLHSILVVKEALSPLELSIQKAAKDLEWHWSGAKDKANSGQLGPQFGGGDKAGKVQICGLKKKSDQCVSASEERKKGLSFKVPIKAFFAKFSPNSGDGDRVEVAKNGGLKDKDLAKEDGSCVNCLQFAVAWSLFVNSFVQAFPGPFKNGKKRFQKTSDEDKLCLCAKEKISGELKQRSSKGEVVRTIQNERLADKEAKNEPLECFIGFVFDKITHNFHKFDQEDGHKDSNTSQQPSSSSQFDHFNIVKGILDGRKADVNGFLGNLGFAKVGGVPSGVVGVTSSVNDEGDDSVNAGNSEETGGISPQKLASGIFSIPLSNVERLRSTLSTVSLAELIELVPHLGRPSKDYPDKKKLFSVQDFFRYTESEGMFFQAVG